MIDMKNAKKHNWFVRKLLYLTVILMVLVVASIQVFRSYDMTDLSMSSATALERFSWLGASAQDAEKSHFEAAFGHENELDGCVHIYIDLGSNVGVQIRKLFEPHLYPDAPIIGMFRQYFGALDSQGRFLETVCAVGFEPNPHHSYILKQIEKAYQKCGHKAFFFTETGASHQYGNATFISDGDLNNLEWGGRVEMIAGDLPTDGMPVKMIRISDFILKKIMTRLIPQSSSKPRILMKVDIEGSEAEVMSDLILTGSLQYIDLSFVEWHPNTYKNPDRKKLIEKLRIITKELSLMSQSLGLDSAFNVTNFDDETYGTSNKPLPNCR